MDSIQIIGSVMMVVAVLMFVGFLYYFHQNNSSHSHSK